MDIAEDHDRLSIMLDTLQIPARPTAPLIQKTEAKEKAERIGYPVLGPAILRTRRPGNGDRARYDRA